MDFFKKVHEFINEIHKYIQDIMLFFQDGHKYFERIRNEDFITNTHRLVLYMAFFVVVQTYLLSEKPTFDFTLVTGARYLLLQLPVLSLGYLFTMSFSNSNNKIKLCLNYVIFQQMITKTIPTLFLAAFIHTESYFFYFFHVALLVVFIFFIIGRFVLLFFQSKIKRVLSGVTVLITIIGTGYAMSYLNINLPNHLIAPFEDPIASEFHILECFEETENANQIVNSTETKRVQITDLVKSINSYLKSEVSIDSETDLFLATKRAKQLLYLWKLEKEKEYQTISRNISALEKKIDKTRYNNSKGILNKVLKTHIQYKDFLDDYEKTLTVLANLDHSDLSETKRKSLEPPTSTVATAMQNVRKIVMNQYQIDLLELNIKMNNNVNKMVKEHVEVANKTISFLKFIRQIETYLPVYYYKDSPST